MTWQVHRAAWMGALMCAIAAAIPASAGQWDEYEAAKRANDSAAAVKVLQSLAAAGDAKAQTELGVMYEAGSIEVGKDFVQAARWYRRAAAQGYTDAQYWLGSMYAEGRGVPQDYQWAHKWLNLAAAAYPDGEFRDQIARARDSVATRMTPEQIVDAQKLAREFRQKPERTTQRPRRVKADSRVATLGAGH